MINYQTERFEECVGKVDAVFDAVGGETLERSWTVLAPGGRLVTIAASSEGAQDQRTKSAYFTVAPDGKRLGEIAGLLDTGALRCFVGAEAPLTAASDAYLGKISRDGRYGKVVLSA